MQFTLAMRENVLEPRVMGYFVDGMNLICYRMGGDCVIYRLESKKVLR